MSLTQQRLEEIDKEIEEIYGKLEENGKYNKMRLIEKLFKYYKELVDSNADLNKLAKEKYGISRLSSMAVKDRPKRIELIDYLFDSIYDSIGNKLHEEEEKQRLKNEWNEATKEIEPEQIPNDNEHDKLVSDYYEQQKLIEEQQKLIEEQQRIINEQNEKYEDLVSDYYEQQRIINEWNEAMKELEPEPIENDDNWENDYYNF